MTTTLPHSGQDWEKEPPFGGLAAGFGLEIVAGVIQAKSYVIATHDGEEIGNTTIETTGPSLTVPVATLTVDKQMLHYRCLVNFRNAAAAPTSLTLRIKFAGLTLASIVSSSLQNTQGFMEFDIYITRLSATTGVLEVHVRGNEECNYTWENYTNELVNMTSVNNSPNFFTASFAVTWAGANTFEMSGDYTVTPVSNPSVRWHNGLMEKLAA